MDTPTRSIAPRIAATRANGAASRSPSQLLIVAHLVGALDGAFEL